MRREWFLTSLDDIPFIGLAALSAVFTLPYNN